MQRDEFMRRLRDVSGLSEAQAVTAMRAVLVTLADRIGPKEAKDTASHLPKGVKEACEPEILNAGEFDASEFLRRVAQRAGISPDEARERARAVFTVLQEAVPEGEREDWQYDLSPDYVDLAARPAEAGGPPRTTAPDSPE